MAIRLMPVLPVCLSLMFLGGDLMAQAFDPPIADTWLKEASPNENHGSDKELSAKNKPADNFRALYSFDLSAIPPNANVTRAELRLRVTAEDDSGEPVNIHRVTDAWSENTANWNNTGNDFDPTVYASFVPDSTGWVRVDISPLVQAWVCGDFSNYGLMLLPTSADKESKYTSREWDQGNTRPRLYLSSSGTNPCLSAPPPQAAGEWRMDEQSWNGSSGEVLDFTGNGHDGTAAGADTDGSDPALAGNPGTCRYGDFDGSNDFVQVPHDAALNGSSALSYTAWIRPQTWSGSIRQVMTKSVHGGGSGRAQMGIFSEGGTLKARVETNDGREEAIGSLPALNAWSHVAAVFDGTNVTLYVNGNPAGSASFASTTLISTTDPLNVGKRVGTSEYFFDGFIDEVRVYTDALSQAQVQAVMAERHACTAATVDHFLINHDAYGIHCVDETITVRAEDASASPVTTYNEQVTLDTQTGNGTWSLIAGSGAFADPTADDGLATYDWPAGESEAVFSLSYTQGMPIFDIDVFQTSDALIRDDDSEGNIEFSASGFTLTALPLGNPPPALIPPFDLTRVAGIDFGIYLAAFGQTASDPECGIIESYTGAQNLKFWFDHVDPTGGSIAVTIDGSAIGTVEATAANQGVAFTNGQAAVTGKYKDAGRIRIRVKDDSLGHPDLPTGIRGATAAFVVKPDHFVLSNIEDGGGNPNPAAADSSGPVFVAAGEPFSVTVTALDAEGDVTPNFGREAIAETVRLTSLLVDPAAGNDPGISPAIGFGPFVAGSATGATFSWPEVGIVTLQPSIGDGDYLGGGEVSGLSSGNVGRFVPSHFTTSLNSPRFETRCASDSFTYIGQPFGYDVNPVITTTARATTGDITQNYTGSYFKITNSSLQNRTYAAASGNLDLSGLAPASSDPVLTDAGGGTGTLLFDSGTGISFLRTSPEAPFEADISLSIDVIDTDNVTTLITPVTFASIAFDNGANMRFGRARLLNAFGSELVNLGVPMQSEYFLNSSTGFVRHTADNCTTNVSLSLGDFKANLSAGETCVVDSGSPGDSGAGCAAAGPAAQRYAEPPTGGDFNLFLLAPGPGNDGSTRITADVPPWMEFNWDDSVPGSEDPNGTARFGVFQGDGKRIYSRELY